MASRSLRPQPSLLPHKAWKALEVASESKNAPVGLLWNLAGMAEYATPRQVCANTSEGMPRAPASTKSTALRSTVPASGTPGPASSVAAKLRRPEATS